MEMGRKEDVYRAANGDHFQKRDAGNIVSADERETPYMLFMSSVCIILHQYL